MNNFIHPTAIVDVGAEIGKNCKIWHFAHVCSKAVVGDNVVLGQNVFVANNVKIGNGCKVQNNVSIYDGVELEDKVFCGPSMVFTNVINPRAAIEKKTEFKKTIVRRGATIGANATILCGVELGEYAFIAAGAVVTADVPAFQLFGGVPARFMGWVNEFGNRVSEKPKDLKS